MIRAVIIDDEPLAIDILEDDLKAYPEIEVIGKFHDPKLAMEFLNKVPIDLLFVDVLMPGVTGTKLLKQLPIKPCVVFVTAHKDFAIEGFELDAVDYLLKPVNKARLNKSIMKVKEHLKARELINFESGYVVVKSGHTSEKIFLKDILFVQGLKDFSKIVTAGKQRPVITLSNLKSLEARLDSARFFRIHKSYIVNLDQITSIRANDVVIAGSEIPIGLKYKTLFKEQCNKSRLSS